MKQKEGGRILVAEDDVQTRRVLVDFLTEWGMEAVACADGEKAWECMQGDGAPRVAILDWEMPGMDGLELCRRIRGLPDRPLTYIVFLTGRGGVRDLAAGLAAGADDYLAKPFDDTELWARIQAGIRLLRLWDEKLALEKEQVLMQAAGAMAHEIAQPLSVIMGQAQLLQINGSGDAKAAERYEAIYQAGQRVDDILRKMEAAHRYALKAYLDEGMIVDLDAAGERPPDPSLLL